MKATRRLTAAPALIFLLALAPASAQNAAGASDPRWKTVFEDALNRAPVPGWNWVREKPGAHKAGKGGLSLQTLPGTLWAKTNTAENFLVRPLPAAGAVRTEVTVTATMAELSEQAGLIWYAGDDDYIKLVKEQKEVAYAILAREENGAAKTYGRVAVPGPEVRLRLTQAGGRVRAEAWMPETKTWQAVGECAPLAASGLRAGFFTHGAPAESGRWASFRAFLIAAGE